MSSFNNTPLENWTVDKSADAYGIRNWSAGYFDVSEKGEVVVTKTPGDFTRAVSVMDIINGVKARGLDMPVLLRVGDILDSRIELLHESFRAAIREQGYKGCFKGVYPIKVNQQKEVVEHVANFGKEFHHGLEAGSKAELIAAISLLDDPEACLICNGYKDQEFVELGLRARKMGIQCFFVIEMPGELDLILERAKALGVDPLIGARIKLTAKAGGQWSESGGDRSVFGLNITQIIEMVDTLKKADMLHCFRLLHYHIGSQIPNIRDIRAGAQEACRVYRGLVAEGAPMGFLDLGGGLAVDYDGSHTNFPSSRNYSIDEYCGDIVEAIITTLEGTDIPHPTIITESGRATVAYYSVLLFNVLDVATYEPRAIPDPLPEGPEAFRNLKEALDNVNPRSLQESFNDAIYYKEEIVQQFNHGRISLRERAEAENIFWHILVKIANLAGKLKYIPDDLQEIDQCLTDIYYCNFSLFQSLPDVWAIDHLFPIMPIHRLRERPTRNGILADITCDCDGKIDKFVDLRDIKRSLPLHEVHNGEEYYLGVFLVGAYQETLGDLHNLLGDTNVATIRLLNNGEFEFENELEGDSVSDVLSYVEYDTREMADRFKRIAERAVKQKLISAHERRDIVDAFNNGLRGYTYFEK